MTSAREIVPVLAVRDWDQARRFYVGVLGFTDGWSYGDPPQYGGVCAGTDDDDPWLHLSVVPPGQDLHPGEVYVYVDDVDDLFARVQDADADILFEPGDRDYGMRDFMVADPWGNKLSFGRELDDDND